VGVLTPAATDATPAFQAFRKGIRDLGYVEGQTIVLDFRFARGNLDAIATNIARIIVSLPMSRPDEHLPVHQHHSPRHVSLLTMAIAAAEPHPASG
jgi:hypothetical protein